jgi:two-component system, NarL family, response regulator NreC
MITIVIADDHSILRQGVKALLDAEKDFKVIGEASDGVGTLEICEKLHPNILILDIAMPGVGGLEVTRRLKEHSPQTRTLILSMHADEVYVMEALRNGADGYILKDESASVLVSAIKDVFAGKRYLSPSLSQKMIDAFIERADSVSKDSLDELTKREKQVLTLAAQGNTNHQISVILNIAQRTAETHRANLMRKLQLRNQSELIRYALKRKLVTIED